MRNSIKGQRKKMGKKWGQVNNAQIMHYVMDLLQVKSVEGRSLLKAEYWRFKNAVEKLTGVIIDTQRLLKWWKPLLS